MIPAGHGPGSLLSEAKRQADGDRLGQIFSTFFEYGRVQAQVHFLFHRVAYLLPVETESRESNHFVDSGVRMVQVQNRTQGVRMPVKRCS